MTRLCTDADCQIDGVTQFDPTPSLDAAIAELTAEQEQEFELLQEVLDARVEQQRYKAALARLLQFRAEQQEAA